MGTVIERGESSLKKLTRQRQLKVRRFIDRSDTMFFRIEKESKKIKVKKRKTGL